MTGSLGNCTHAPILRDKWGHCVACEPVSSVPIVDLEEALATLQRARAEKCRRSLYDFLRYGWHVLEPDTDLDDWWHLKAICDHVQWVLEGWLHRRDPEYAERAKNLLINVPPGTLKSRIVSVYAPAWMWLHAPHWRVLCVSINPRVSMRDADFSKTLIKSEWYQTWFAPDWEIREDKDATSCYGNTKGGQRDSMGWHANIVGQRADALILDDPNDVEKVHSDATRNKVNNTYENTLKNRVNDERFSLRLGIQQRAHAEDFSACFLRVHNEVLHLLLDTEFDPKYPRPKDTARKPIAWVDPRVNAGEVLHPARMTPNWVAEQKKNSARWAAQYQQRPEAAGGAMFKWAWFKWYKPDGKAADGNGRRPWGLPQPGDDEYEPAIPLPRLQWVAMTVDANFKKTIEGSRVSVQVWGGARADRFLLDCITRPMDFIETLGVIKQLHTKWSPGGLKDQPSVSRILIEDKANGPAAINSLKRDISGVIPIEPEGGKESRGMACQPQIESGNVYLPEGAPFLEVSSEGGEGWWPEVTKFPNGSRDDQPDAMTQLLNYYAPTSDVARALAMARM